MRFDRRTRKLGFKQTFLPSSNSTLVGLQSKKDKGTLERMKGQRAKDKQQQNLLWLIFHSLEDVQC